MWLRCLDLLEAARARLWRPAFAPLTPWAFLLPALLLTGLLVAGLVPAAGRQPAAARIAPPSASPTIGRSPTTPPSWQRPVYAWIGLRTLLAAVIVTVVALALAFPYAWVMVRTPRPWLRKLLLVGLFLPFFIGQVVRAYGWLIVLGKQGLLNSGLAALGLPTVGILYTYPGVLIGLVQYMLPFAVLMLAPALTAVPEEVELASASLGARPLATFRHIVLPLARPGLVAAAVVVFTLTLTDFAMPEIMGGGGNDFIASAIYDAFFQLGDAGLGGALGVVLTLVGSPGRGHPAGRLRARHAGLCPVGRGQAMRRGFLPRLLLAVAILDLIFLALPTLVVLAASFTSGNIVTFPPQGFSLRWYANLLDKPDFLAALWRSLQVGCVCTLLAIPAGTLAALALARFRLRFATGLQVYLLLPFTVPLVVSGIGLMLVFGPLGWLGSVWPVGLACCVINLPFMIWAVAAAANHLDPDLELAAWNCGAPPTHAFFTVTLPALAPGIVTGALVMFILAVNEFLVSLMLVDARTVTLPVLVYNAIRSTITPDLAAVSVVYVVLAAGAIWLLDRLVGLDLFLKAKQN